MSKKLVFVLILLVSQFGEAAGLPEGISALPWKDIDGVTGVAGKTYWVVASNPQEGPLDWQQKGPYEWAVTVHEGEIVLLANDQLFADYQEELIITYGERGLLAGIDGANPPPTEKAPPRIVCEPWRCASAVVGGAIGGAVAGGSVAGGWGAAAGAAGGAIGAYGSVDSCKKRNPEKCGE